MGLHRTYWSANLGAPLGPFWRALIRGDHDQTTRVPMTFDSLIGDAGPNLISSKLENGKHAPIIDLDGPHRLVPSTTPGHSHLYLDVEMSWFRYVLLLAALRYAGVIERGFFLWSLRRGQTFARLPWVKKQAGERTSG